MKRITLVIVFAVFAAAAVADSGNQPTAGDAGYRIEVDGRTRSYEVYVPLDYDASRPFPVVLAYHGGGGNARWMRDHTGLNNKADEAGFIVVYPNGTGRFGNRLLTWNAGTCCGYAMKNDVDDVAFTRAMLDDLERRYNVDRRRVYATGMSNGAMLSYRLASELSDRIAAIAPVAATMGFDEIQATRPVPVLHIHGDKDMNAAFEGGIGPNAITKTDHMPVMTCIRKWVEHNGCPAEPKVSRVADKADDGMRVRKEVYSPGSNGAEVVLYVVEGGGHTWPGRPALAESMPGWLKRAPRSRKLGASTQDISANDLIWEFFSRRSMPARDEAVAVERPSAEVAGRDLRRSSTSAFPEPFEVFVPMRDGARISANVYIPEDGRAYPAILIFTPYNKKILGAALPGASRVSGLIGNGDYAFVVADWRGFFGSKASAVDPRKGRLRQVGEDGCDLVEWIAAQPWSNGKVGMWGPSALGMAQYQTAAQQPPHLVCIAPIVARFGMSYEEFYHGGVLKRAHNLVREDVGFSGSLARVTARPVYDRFWTWIEHATQGGIQNVNVPVLAIGGWYDIDTDSLVRTFDRIGSAGGPVAREHSRLVIGPWDHMDAAAGKARVGELEFPEAARVSEFEAQRFFDYWLRNQKDNGWDATPRVRYFQMGGGTWHSADSWPPAGVREHVLYLHPGGRLETSPQTGDAPPDTFVYDPRNPSPTVGGLVIAAAWVPSARELKSGPADQRAAVESRCDVLIYTSGPLDKGLVVRGNIRARLFVSSDQIDTDFMVRVCDVYPDGRSMLITDGAKRMRFRDSLRDPEFMTPGETSEATVSCATTAHTFREGHRVRLLVTSSNYPCFDVNPNNGEHFLTDPSKANVAKNKVYRDETRRSVLIIPTGKALNARPALGRASL